jgi:hypothetical protein
MQFPKVNGSNLLRQNMTLPAALKADLNVVLVAFKQWQQGTVDTWLPFLEDLESRVDGLRYYELPVIRRMNFLASTFINEGMRAGIPNQKARERTITLYLNKEKFRQALAMPHENDIYILVLDRQGKVLWRSAGGFTAEKGEALEQAIEAAMRQGPEPTPAIEVELEPAKS